tara:strand:+ start:2471 stop:5911 length:3441 start_codon:yes stop_codon:yes gene_type:complete
MNTVTRLILFSLLILFWPTDSLLAQVVIPISKPAIKTANQSQITLSAIREKIDTVKNKANLEEALKQRILNAYDAAEANLEEVLILEQQIQGTQNRLMNLPDEIKYLEKRINEAEDQLKNQRQDALSLGSIDDLEQQLIIKKSNLNGLITSISHLEIQISEQLKRPQQIREQEAKIKDELTNIQQEQGTLSTLVRNQQELYARQALISSRSSKLYTILDMLNLENLAYPLSLEVKKLELQFLNLKSKQVTSLIKHIDDFLIAQRQQEIKKEQQMLIRAKKAAANKHPAIRAITEENIHYNKLLLEVNNKLEQYVGQKNKIESRKKQLENDFNSAEQKINLAKLNPYLGYILRKQHHNLPLAINNRDLFDNIQQEISLASLEQFKLDEQKTNLMDLDQNLLSRISAYATDHIDEKEELKIHTELRELLVNKKELVKNLISVYSEYLRTLADFNYTLQKLVDLGEKFNIYLNERLLWVSSAPVIDEHYVLEIFKSIVWFSNFSHWQQLSADIKHSVQINPLLALLGAIVILLLLWFRRGINVRLQDLLEKASKPYVDRFAYTYYGLGYIFLLVLPFPMLLALPGWLLFLNKQTASFSNSVADGLLVAAVPLLTIRFFYRLFKPQGFVQTLFGWRKHSVYLIRGQLNWIRLVVIPAMFLIGMFADGMYFEHSYTLGRLALIIVLLAMTYVFHRFAHPVKGLGKDFYHANPNSWVCRLRYFWYVNLVLAPLIIIGFAIAGYYQSAIELQHKLIILLRLIFFAVLLHEIVMRWLVLANRQMALQNARHKRKLQGQAIDKDKAEGKDKTGAKDYASTPTINPEEEFLLDIPQINQQSKRLLGAITIAIIVIGFWLTLSDMLPAFSIFDQVVLWQHMDIVDGVKKLQSITLVNVFLSLLYLVLMLIFVNNFPSLIDLFFVGRYRMTSGSRYAAIHLTRYAVFTITFITIVNELGGKWSEVQWLVAAISVGLGFGLQEIFANMVSGIILLFERPIRVGDTVTVGDITGKVSRIQIRATTIVDWDQRELVVPNKVFITDKLVNWTLTDPVTRVVIPIGIAYGSDEELAMRIFKQVSEETSLILKTPEPSVFFVGFGESSLDFSLRVYVRNMEDRLPVTDELHRRINRAFKEHNIEIPFPQRDLHIRSSALANGQI